MLALLAFISFSTFAQAQNNYTYQAQIIASSNDCATEAKNWSLRFANATGAQVKLAACRSEQTVSSENKSYKVYNLGLSYSGKNPLYPYTALIGKKDAFSPIRLYEVPIYPTMDSCLADSANQTTLFEQETGLKAVTVSCSTDSPFLTYSQYFLKIEGFDNNPNFYRSQPKKSLYTFAPYAFNRLRDDRQIEVRQFLASLGATVVQQAPGFFVYYRADGPAPLNAEELGLFSNVEECPFQTESVKDLFGKAGSQNLKIWCTDDGRLQVLHDGSYSLAKLFSGASQNNYSSLNSCLGDIEFVLSDSRNTGALGALCAPSTYDSKIYSMTLYRKGY